MPIEKTVTLYFYEELSEKAKEKAREWWTNLERECFDASLLTDSMVEYADWKYGLWFGKQIYWDLYNYSSGVWFNGLLDEANFMKEPENSYEDDGKTFTSWASRRQELQNRMRYLTQLDVSYSVRCNYNRCNMGIDVEICDDLDFDCVSAQIYNFVMGLDVFGDGEVLRKGILASYPHDGGGDILVEDEYGYSVEFDYNVCGVFFDWCDENGIDVSLGRVLLGGMELWESYIDSFREDMECYIRDAADDLLKFGRSEYEYQTENLEMIEDTMKLNQYTFDEFGNRED